MELSTTRMTLEDIRKFIHEPRVRAYFASRGLSIDLEALEMFLNNNCVMVDGKLIVADKDPS
jgi:hypothetical protein